VLEVDSNIFKFWAWDFNFKICQASSGEVYRFYIDVLKEVEKIWGNNVFGVVGTSFGE